MNTEEFVKKATEKHSGKYTYEKSVYTGAENKVIITCKKHGDFEQTPFAHLAGQGCPKCARNRTDNAQRDTLQDFIYKSNLIHSNQFSRTRLPKMCWAWIVSR